MKLKMMIIITTVFFFAACSTTKNATASYTYTKDVKAVIDEQCGNKCHNAERPADGIDLTTYEKVKDQAMNGKLIPAIQHMEGVEPMPKKNPKLDDATIERIVAWVAAGAAE